MNKKKILQLILTSTTVAGGMSLANASVEATELNHNSINDKESIITFNNSYEGKVVNVDTNLRVRADASKESKVIGYLKEGEVCEIKAETVEWYRINFNGNEGYVDKEYVEPINKSKSHISVQKGQVAGTEDGLIVRQSASVNSARLTLLKDGDLVEIISKSGEWYNIKIGSTLGFVYEKYINVVEEELTKPNDSTVKGKVNEISSNLRLRSEASNDSAIVGYLLGGQEVEILDEDGDWYKVSYNEKVGYVNKEYITKVADSDLNVPNDDINKESDLDLDTPSNELDNESDSDLDVSNDNVDKEVDVNLEVPGNDVDKELNNDLEASNDSMVEEKDEAIINTDEESKSMVEYSSNGASIRERSITGQGTVINANEGLRVRLSASVNSIVIGHVYTGNKLDVIGIDGDWYKVKFNNTTGYVHKDYVNFTEAESNITGQGTVINANDGLRVRKSASTSAEVLGYVYTNDKLDIIGSSGDWYKVKFNNTTGYVHKDYIKVTQSSGAGSNNNNNNNGSTGESNITGQGTVINANDGLRVRKSASTSAEVLGYVYTNNKLDIIGSSGDWYKVKFNNTTGYVHKDYVKINESAGSGGSESNNNTSTGEDNITGQGTVINANEGLRVRESASTSAGVLGHVYTGNKLDIIGSSGEWYKVKFNNTTGYVHKDYVKLNELGGAGSNNDGSTGEVSITGKGTVINSDLGLRIRQSASTDSAVLGYLYTGNEVDITGASGSWYKINYNGKEAYVHKDYIKFTESNNSGSNSNNNNNGSTGEVDVNAKGKVINANEGLRVRESANSNASVLGYVYTDNILEIVGTNGNWYKVKFRDTTGYVHKDYVEIMNATNPNPPGNNESENIKQKGEVYNTGSNLRVRESASANSVVLGYLTDGSKVDIIGSDGDWYKINYKDKVGYVSKDYIKLINDTENPFAPPTENPNPGKPGEGGSNENYINIISMGSVASSNLNVRSGAGTDFETIGTLTINTIVEIVETSSNGWHKIKYNNGFGYVSSEYIKISTNSSNYSMSLDQYVDMQYPKLNMTDNSGEWTTATKEEIRYNMDSSNFIDNSGKYMFMKLNYIDGFSLDLVNEVIEGRGILSGKGQAFLDGARKYNVNVMYLLTHARLETGNGTSTLSTGVLVTEVDGQPVEPRIVYNMYGVGAIDSDPLRGGAEYAYKQGWFTPELAITEGASWISRNYINNAEEGQNTLYKMKWDISSSGVSWHQYASDIAWAEKQARLMAPYLEKCGVALEFDIPTFGKGK